MLVKLCVRNYESLDGFMNGADGMFEDYIETISKTLVWIHFHNSQTIHNTQIKNLQMYGQFPILDKKEHQLNINLLK
jgi:hypothetical protein